MKQFILFSILFVGASANSVQAQNPDQPLRVAVVDFNSCTKPAFPPAALDAGLEGVVKLGYLIGTDGKVRDARIDKSSGYPVLDKTALTAIRACAFKPGTQDGVPVESWTVVTYVWSLDPDSKKDRIAAMARLRARAESGIETAELQLGLAYLTGVGPAPDMAQGAVWLEKAALKGNPKAQEALGRLYLSDMLGAPDPRKAVGWFRQAAEQGSARPQGILGLLLWKGEGVPQDEAEAISWLRKSASQGESFAQFHLAMVLIPAVGQTGNMAESVSLLAKAAAQGHREAQTALAGMYERGEGVARDLDKARELNQAASRSKR